MKNALNTNKTVANHYLNPINRFWAKPLMILSILLTAMFILAACGGGAAAPAGVTPTTNPCVGNPFGSTCNSPADQARRTTVVQTCLAAGAANTAVCAQAIVAEPCIVDPLGKDTDGTDCSAAADFIAYLPDGTDVDDVVNTRATYCNGQTTTPDDICDGVIAACDAANPFANAACGKVSNINTLRTTYCTNAATTWNDNCDVEATYTGAKDARDTACLAFGTNAGGDADCHDRLALLAACPVTDPFAEPGCASADGIDGLRTTYCTTGNTIFDLECGALDVDTAEIITGTHAARNTACEESGTGAGDDNDCATRANIVATCTEASPFTNTGCDTATHITPQIRTTFCVKTDENDGKNPFTVGCPSSESLDPALNTARDTACETYGTDADATCATRENIMMTCTEADPFANTGCNTATHILAGNNAIRTEFCTNGVNIFHPMCVETTHGAVNAARANLIATCKDNSGAFVCTNTPINGVSGGTSVADCNANVFSDMDGCNTHPAFNPQRISICTTDATSFNAGCIEATYAGTDAARLSFATACADISTTTDGCDTAFLNGVDGTTVDQCNANPFDTANDCATNSAFDARRMSVCTTGATSFNAGCVEATYTGTNDARISFAEACADAPGTMGCDTAYINGVDGTTVDACNANPFLTDCDTSGSFASAQTARNELCVATNDPFNALCEIEQFPTMNEANRDTYCQETALPAEGEAGGNCVGDRLTAICTTEATYNPFAPLCGTTNTAARMAFCGVNTQNPNCETVEATLCAANPFGTNLGPDADVNCVGGSSDYSSNRKDLADACRTNSEGTGCTDAINNCNANPFNPTAFSGGTCDQAAFADAQTAYCADPATTWQASCNAMAGKSTQNDITVARSGVCAANGAIMTGTVGDDVAAGESLFDARCTALTGATDSVTITNAQLAYCTDAENPWQGGCDRFGTGGADENAAVETARNNVCLNNGAIPSNGANGNAILAGDSLFDTLCGSVATIDTVRAAECKTDAFAWHTGCQDLAGANSGDNDVAKARARICFGDLALDRGGDTTLIAEGESFFSVTCDGLTNSAGDAIADVRLNHCKEAGNAWQDNCNSYDTGETNENTEVAQARDTICLANGAIVTGTEANDVAAGASLFNSLCAGATSADSMQTADTARTAWCTVGANIFDSQCVETTHGGVEAARQAACAQDTAHESVGTNNCISRAEGICGDDDNAGSNPFAAICGVATQNINYFAELADSQQDYCGIAGNNGNTVCDTTVASVCAPGGTALTNDGIFADICARDDYNTARVTYCSEVADSGDTLCDRVQTGTDSIKMGICDGAENTDNPHATVCGTDNVAAQETFCGLTHETDPTGCAATRTTACADTDGNNPFNEDLCYEPGNTFDAQRTARADACRGDSPTRTGDECSAEVNACNVAPFGMHDGEDCSAVVYANARTAFCTVGDDIFDDNCGADGADTYGATTAARQAACESSDALPANIEDDDCNTRSAVICGDATTEGSNAFATICSLATQNANHAVYEAAQAFYCHLDQGNLSNAECPNVTSGDWVASFTENDGIALTTDPTGTDVDQTRHNEFLAITGNTISTAGTTSAAGGSDAPTNTTTLDFTAIKYNNQALTGLSATNGLAFFTGFHGNDTEESAYAGIYETADLGGPIVDSVTGATWSGALQILDAGTVVEADFNLNVTFISGDGGGAGLISAFIANVSGDKDFNINGTFDASGVLLTASNVYYGEMGDSSPAPTPNGRLSGIIGQDGAIGVFVSNDTEALYTGGFVATGVCSVNIFDAGCLLDNENGAETAFCTNATDNTGKNPFNPMCNTDGSTHGNVAGARVIACRAFGDAADDSCKNSDEVRGVCDGDPFAQTTGLATNMNLCTGENDMNVAYADARTACETAGTGSFDTECDAQDQLGKVKEARDTYCRDTAPSTDTANCGAGTGQVDRIAQFCTAGTGTSIFSAVCAATGTVTIAQSTACGGAINDLTARGAVATDCKTNDLSSTICGTGSNPGSDPFAPICGTEGAPAGFMQVAAQLALCKGELTGFAGNAVVTDCKAGGQSGTICGAGAVPGEDPFAPICGAAGAPPDGIDLAGAQLAICSGPVNELTDGGAVATDCKTDPLAGAICGMGSTPGSDPFAPICGTAGALASYNQVEAQLAICNGPSAGFDGAAELSDCQTNDLSGAICGLTSSAPGSNPWAYICGQSSATLGGFVQATAQDNACLASGAAGAGTGNDCDTRDNVRRVCNGNPYTQTTGLTTNVNLCTGTNAGGDSYADARTACETAGTGSFAENCDTQDQIDKVKTARDTYCRETAPSTDTANCGAGTGHANRIEEFCTESTGTSIFSAVCAATGTVTTAQTTACGGATTALSALGAELSDCKTTLLAGAICGTGTTPGSDPFAPICSESDAIITGFDIAAAQLAICGGELSGFNGAAVVTDCKTDPLAGAICGTGSNPGSDPFAPICSESDAIITGFDIAAAQLAICSGPLGELTDGAAVASDCKTAPLAGAICGTGSTPGSDPFAPICSESDAIITGFDIAAAQLAICSGPLGELTDGAAVASDCKTAPLAGAICGTGSTPGSDPFAPICSESDAIITGFDIAAAQLAICSGPLGELTDGAAVASDCNDALLSGAICGTGSNPGSDPFAPICSESDAIITGFDIAAAQLAICSGPLGELTDGAAVVTDCKTAPLAGAICGTGSTPGSDPFAPICSESDAIITGFDIAAAQLAICSGPLGELTDGAAVASDCNDALLSGAICGTGSNPGSDPFAPICSESDAIITGFDIAAAQLAICSGPVNELTDGAAVASDCKTAPLAGAICGTGSTPGSDPFAPICSESDAIITGFDIAAAQLAICGGPVNELTDGAAVASDCKTAPLAGAICGTGSTPGSDPFAPICSESDAIITGFDIAAAQLAICGGPVNELTDGAAVASDCKTAPLAGAICGTGSNPGSDPFAPICSESDAIITGFDIAAAQLAICSGPLGELTDGAAVASDCNDALLSGAICGTGSTPGSDPFAPICSESDAIITGFDIAAAQLAICGGPVNELTDGAAVASDCKTAPLAGAICGTGSNPGSDPFAPICSESDAIITGFDIAAAQLAICSGPLGELTDGAAVASDCNDALLSGAICGTGSNPGTDPFAPICSESDAIIAGFNRVAAQLALCGGELSGFNGAAVTSDCKTAPLAGAICGTGSTPGSDPFAPICSESDAIITGFDIAAAQLAICGGPLTGFNGAAEYSDCKTGGQANMICGQGSTPGTNAFAEICTQSEATAVGYMLNIARGTACVGLSDSDRTTNNCGNEAGVGGNYIQAYCAAGGVALNNHRDCRSAYETEQGSDAATVAKLTSGGVDRALNATGTGPLTGNDGFKGSGSDTANRADFIIDVDRDPSNTDLDIPNIQSAGHLTLNSLDPSNNDGRSGFALARSQYGTTLEDNRYVGLLYGTDLGAPLTANFTATWNAMIMVIVNQSDTIQNTFQMAVDFNDRSIKNNVVVNVATFGNVTIDGKFTANGVIYGTVGVNDQTVNEGTLTGLIGEKGAVGIFKSSNTTSNPYVGGFVAAPTIISPVVVADWTASFASGEFIANDSRTHGDLFPTGSAVTTIPDGQTRFLEWTSTQDFALDGVNKLTIGGTNTGTLLLNNEANNGIGYVYDTTDSPVASRGFAGLLSATDVGLPLDTVATATWSGTIAGVATGFAFSNTFDLMVDYTKTSADNAGTVTSAVRAFPTTDNTKMISFGFNGTFNDAGVMIGTVSHVFNTTTSSTNRAGVFNGLIGQAGAVGVFKSDGIFEPYVGGFVAKPPAGGGTIPPVQDEVDCTDELGATLFDESCTENDDEQTRACINGTDAANMDFTANCVDNDRVTNLVCTTSGLRANPFNAALCTDMNTGNTLTLKKSHSLISAPLL